MIKVQEVTAGDWELLRDVRLAALLEAPNAFGSTHAREASFTEAQWRGRISARAIMFFGYPGAGGLAGEGAAPAGLAGVYVENGEADLVSMWVRPSARGLGVGAALVEAAADWARARSHDALYLWVTESNEPARRLYSRSSFLPTGERQPLPSDPAFAEIRMRRAL